MKPIRLKGELKKNLGDRDDLFLIDPGTGGKGNPIATREQVEEFKTGVAHLYSDGRVKRYGQVIGSRDDIEILEETNE